LDDFEPDSEPPAGEPMELLCEDHNGTYVIPFLVVGLTALGAASRPTIRLKPTSLGGEGNEDGASNTGPHAVL